MCPCGDETLTKLEALTAIKEGSRPINKKKIRTEGTVN
jgi:hypothetical protein